MPAIRLEEQAIFEVARKLDSRETREAYVQQICGDDAALGQRVRALLQAHDKNASFLEAPALPLSGAADESMREGPGAVIGPYKLLEQIGEGGFGIVFMAEQTQPVRRKVALKILKPGMDTRQVVARFEAERQALALMDHTNIARVFDGGDTPSGRPYFVMELVRGIPITDYCDRNQLPVRVRLGLFIDVCEAVQHAHQKGIIHRDLKPTNILVTLHDDKPIVKVIDFGIAKAMGQQLTEKTLFTNFAQMIGTPLYMSPEQSQMSGLDVDTRSDIYALGVLLYELLTGATPFDKERLRRLGYDEIRRIIREEEPPRPSTRFSTLGAASATVSANRRSNVRELGRQVRGELDWIVLKALEKDRNRRYETVSAFAADLQRYLRDEPVLACPPSAWYQLRKMVRRNQGTVLAASFVVLALVGGIIGTTWGLVRATVAEADALEETKQKTAALTDKEAALADARHSLFLALVNRAQAVRGSARLGQRFETLKAIRAAAEIRVTPELRTEATAALVLADADIACEWEAWPDDSVSLDFDSAFQRYARLDKHGQVTICHLSQGREEVWTRLPAHGKPPFGGVLMSPDGRFVAYKHGVKGNGVAAGVRVWKLDGLQPLLLLDDAGAGISAWAFDPQSRHLAFGHADKTITVLDLATSERPRSLKVSAVPTFLAFHPRDGRIAVACGNTVLQFDANRKGNWPMLQHPAGIAHIHGLAWHPDGRRLATGCDDRKIHVWDTQSAVEVMTPWAGHAHDGVQVAFNHSGDRLVSGDWGGQTRLWDAANGRLLLTMPEHFGRQFSADDCLLGWGSSGNKLRLHRLAHGRELCVLRPRNADILNGIYGPVVHADGGTVAASSPQQLTFFDLASGEELASVRLEGKDAVPVSYDPPHRRLLPEEQERDDWRGGWMTAGGDGLLLWPTVVRPKAPGVLCVGPPQQLAPYTKGDVRGASASSDGCVVALPQGDSLLLLHRDPATGGVLRRLILGPQHDLRFSAVSPDGRLVFTGSHWGDGRWKSAVIWDADSGKHVQTLPLEGSVCARFSPDGRWLATYGSAATWSRCRLWDVATWREGRRFEAGGSVAFSPDSRLLAIGDVLGVVRLVETETGREIARLTGPEPM